MTRTRNMSDLLDSSGDVKATALDNTSSDLVDDSTPQLGGDLSTNGNDVNFGDNDKAQFGAGNDLQIYHDGSSSKIVETGTGSLQLGGTSSVDILSGDLGEYLARFHDDGKVELRYDNVSKLETTSDGIDVLRPASDGTIQSWKRGTTEVAKLSVGSTDNIEFSAMQGGGAGLQFWGGGGTDPVISPMKQGVSSDNTVELGRSNVRFKKFHLTEWGTAPSGTVLQVNRHSTNTYLSGTIGNSTNPTSTSGTLFTSMNFTPKSSSSKIYLWSSPIAMYETSNVSDVFWAGAWYDTTKVALNYVPLRHSSFNGGLNATAINVMGMVNSWGTSLKTIKIRVGCGAGSGSKQVNRDSSYSNQHGGNNGNNYIQFFIMEVAT